MSYRMTKTERLARERLYYHYHLFSEDFDDHIEAEVRNKVPEAWHMIEQDIDCDEPKEKVTLYLDRSVAKAFRAMGRGYQARINRLLLTWLQLRAGRLLKTDEMIAARRQRILEREEAAREAGQEVPLSGPLVGRWPREG